MCRHGLMSQCETTQVRDEGKGAALFGYTSLYGAVPGGQAEYLRVPQAQFGPIKVPEAVTDEQVLYLSDVLPTAWQAVEYADVPAGGTVAVLGLGPIGLMAVSIAVHRGAGRVIGLDLVPERLARAQAYGAETVDVSDVDDVASHLIDLVDGRGPDAVIDAVGMEAHGSKPAAFAQSLVGKLPDAVAQKVTDVAGIDRLDALIAAFKGVRRGGTVSVVGVYGGEVDPLPMMEMFDRGITIRMGQANVRRWIDDLLPLVVDDGDPLGVRNLATHRLPLTEAPHAYDIFQKKEDGCIKVVLQP